MTRICLSFDNGPDPIGTPKVLEVLKRLGLRSSFFVLGKQLERKGGLALAEQIREAGHKLGNHSYSHTRPLGQDPRPDAVAQELARTEALLEKVWKGPRLFRPYGGGGKLGPHLLSPASADWLKAQRYTVVLWTSVPGDFRDPIGWPARALEDCEAQEDVLMVLHDVAVASMDRLEPTLEAMLERGHRFVQDFPSACLPLVDGQARHPLAPYMSDPGRFSEAP